LSLSEQQRWFNDSF
jgi:hypothetical protein